MYNLLKKYIDPIIPLFGILPLLSCFALNMLVYCGTIFLAADWYHYDFTLPIDNMIPLVPGWMLIYFGCYLFWVVNYILVARCYRDNEDEFYRFVATDMMSRLVCAIFFLLLPTTNIRPEVIGTGLWDKMLIFLYNTDPPANLFPSIHCLVSWLCYVGIRRSKNVSMAYKVFSCIFALLVVASTQFTKQHYLVDAVAGLALAELLYWMNHKISAYKLIQRFFTWVNSKIYSIIKKGETCEQ